MIAKLGCDGVVYGIVRVTVRCDETIAQDGAVKRQRNRIIDQFDERGHGLACVACCCEGGVDGVRVAMRCGGDGGRPDGYL